MRIFEVSEFFIQSQVRRRDDAIPKSELVHSLVISVGFIDADSLLFSDRLHQTGNPDFCRISCHIDSLKGIIEL